MKPRPPSPFQARLSDIDALIRGGHQPTARRALLHLVRRKLARETRLPAAKLARRAGLFQLSLRLLSPIVRPDGRFPTSATDAERAEYAASLVRAGAPDEALRLLDEVRAEAYPSALLYQAFGLVARWDYADSIAPLSRYLTFPIDDYSRLVAKVNLAAAYVHERRHDEAETLLGELRRETLAHRFGLLHGNALELAAQNAILQGAWKEGAHRLQAADAALASSESLDGFFVRKWQAVWAVRRSGGTRKSLRALEIIREQAAARRHWETLRDCDYFEALTTGREELIAHLYFGTPFPSFHRRLSIDFGQIVVPSEYLWRLGPDGPRTILDLTAGSVPRSKAKVRVGSLFHRLLVALSADFYRPSHLTGLHAALHPGDYYHPVHSPVRLRQALRRLRKWARQAHLPFGIEHNRGAYRLFATSPFALRLSRSPGTGDPDSALLDKLRAKWGAEFFSVAEVSRHLALPLRSSQRFLSRVTLARHLERNGRGPATRYRFNSQSKR